ncbi:MAG: hypothetical protein J3Q66DRAFT_355895 [Benniella sp.]|nr:MAG: hypothetical protein J3Q66DRAFT_355895 [Benniella sp.]
MDASLSPPRVAASETLFFIRALILICSITLFNLSPSTHPTQPDSSTLVCKWPGCPREFGFFDRRHHCRKCGDIFCSAHCSKAIPLDYGLEFNPAMGVMSRACPACFEAYEQWRGLGTTTTTTTTRSTMKAGALGSISDSSATTNSGVGKDGLLSSHNTRKSEGRLGQTGNSSSETLGREDIVRLPKSVSDTIAIKTRPVEDTTMMPMPSVPHDWSWSTF